MKKHLLLIVAVSSLLLFVGGWFFMKNHASNQAEEVITDKLYEMGLLNSVTWDSVEASALGGEVKVKDILFNNELDKKLAPIHMQFSADELILRGFNTDERVIESAEVEVNGIKVPNQLPSGESNFLFELYKPTLVKTTYKIGVIDLPASDHKLTWDLDNNSAYLTFELKFPELIQLKYEIDIGGRFRPVIEQLVREPDNYMAVISMLETVTLKSLKVKWTDDGYMSKSYTLTERYAHANASLDEEVDIEKNIIQTCQDTLGSALSNADGCENFYHFVSGQNKQLQAESQFSTPIGYQDFVEIILGTPSSKFKFHLD